MEINFSNVDYSYNNKTPIIHNVLKDINLNFKEGKIYSIIGKSGSGKTTFLELIDGLSLPTNGFIKMGNICLKSDSNIKNVNSLRIKVGLVFQFPEEQFFCKTVEKEIEFALLNFNCKGKDYKKRIIDSLKMVGLDENYLDRDPFTLSHGEMRLLALASVLIYNPSIIVLDEPTIGLDSLAKKNLIRLLKMLKTRYNKLIIVVSHDTDMLLKISDEVLVLENGSIVISGNKYDVFSNEKVLKRNNIKVPDLIKFSNIVKKKKNIKIGYRDEINDLIKDIYRYVK